MAVKEIRISANSEVRGHWLFSYLGKELLEGAKKKLDHHQERLSYHEEALDEAEQEIRENGISIETWRHSGGRDMKAQVNPALGDKWKSHKDRVDHHTRLVAEYKQWCRVLERNQEETFSLALRDVDYFGL